MLGSLQPTSYDLRFSLFGIPVRVQPTFWLGSIVLGWTSVQLGFAFLGAWVAVVFVSILVHELGHALTAAALGYPPRIVLYHFGGLAMYEPYSHFTTGKSILITLAGPFAGFALFGLVFLGHVGLASSGAIQDVPRLGQFALLQLEYVNLWWGLLNLLPVLPLDGGHVCRDVCTSLSPRRGMDVALTIALITGAGMAFYGFQNDRLYIGILFAMLAFENFQELQRRRYF